MIKLDLSNTINPIPFKSYAEEVKKIHKMINEKTGLGNDFLGWTTWPKDYDKEEFARIKEAAKNIRKNYDVLVVAGIGGSYLGARAAIEALKGLYGDDKLEIIFFGNTLSPTYIKQVLTYLENKKFAINVISKSGTTTETSVAFRLLKELLIKKVGKEAASKAIFATTDKARGALKKEADEEGYETFVIPDDIGGRYSVITAVGLLPIACAGCDIDQLMKGCRDAMNDLNALRAKRIEGYQEETISDVEALIEAIRTERRKELCFEGHRWFDLRRYEMPSIKHVFQNSEDSPVMEFVLEEKDPMYTLPLPASVTRENTALVQNSSAYGEERTGEIVQ